ncbi:MAG: hypothetical protein ACYC1L_11055 [Alphaproteobacteria bacterium]
MNTSMPFNKLDAPMKASRSHFGIDHYLAGGIALIVVECLVISWHVLNNALPTSDGVTYLTDSYRVMLSMRAGDLGHALDVFYTMRGWRPHMFPIFGVLPLLISGGDVLFAVGTVSVFFSSILVIYIYLFLRMETSPVVASAGTIILASGAYVFSYSTNYFSEAAYLPMSVGALYHLFRSDNFKSNFHSLAAGILLGGCLGIRPGEAVMLALPGLVLAILGLHRKTVQGSDFLIVFNVVLAAIAFLYYATYVIGIGTGIYISVTVLAVLGGLALRTLLRSGRRNFVVTVIAASLIAVVWWTPAVGALMTWMIAASRGQVVQTLGLGTAPVDVILQDFFSEWRFQAVVLVTLAVLSFVGTSFRNWSKRLCGPFFLTALGMGAIAIFMLISVVSDGQAARRMILIGTLVGIWLVWQIAYAAPLVRPFLSALLVIAAVGQVAIAVSGVGLALSSSSSAPVKKVACGNDFFCALKSQYPRPNMRKPDRNIEFVDRLKQVSPKYGLTGTFVNMLLLEGTDVIINPFSAGLAAIIENADFAVGMTFIPPNEDPYEVNKRAGSKFLAVDVTEDLSDNFLLNQRSNFGKFAASVIMDYRHNNLVKLEALEVLDVGGRKVLLLKNLMLSGG